MVLPSPPSPGPHPKDMSQLPAVILRDKPVAAAGESPPVVRIQKMIFEEAAAIDASDVHIEPGRTSTRVRCRVDGILRESFEVPKWMHENLVVRIKVLAKLDISERRIPQDGHITAEESHGMDIRVSVLPTRWGEKVVIRMLRRGRSLMALTQLGFKSGIEERLHGLIRRPQGIVLSVGPTGSGKTTTLYALVNEIRQEPINIVTIEDPVEYEVDGVSQVPVNEKTGLTFARALRSILRQDPDVILVGEIRDSDTAVTAFHAAMTGHLVLSTLHASDAISAVLRLAELGVDRSVLASALIGVVAQRLVRLNCRACAEPDFPRPIYLQHLSIDESRQAQLRLSKGCDQCKSTGSRGRVGVYELMEIQARLRNKILTGTELDIREAAGETGFESMAQQAVDLILAGELSVREAYRTCYVGGE
jgi:type II secretory ATPase GspE/PulE/Tfp pilus assembly ATPase PilB-like protein